LLENKKASGEGGFEVSLSQGRPTGAKKALFYEKNKIDVTVSSFASRNRWHTGI
jgi:hypothetical protein